MIQTESCLANKAIKSSIFAKRKSELAEKTTIQSVFFYSRTKEEMPNLEKELYSIDIRSTNTHKNLKTNITHLLLTLFSLESTLAVQ